MLLGVRAVIAESFERIHRSNLIGMGVLPLQFTPGQSAAIARTDRAGDLRHHRLRSRAPRARQQVTATPADGQPRSLRGAGAHRYAQGARVLPARRHPAVRAAPAGGPDARGLSVTRAPALRRGLAVFDLDGTITRHDTLLPYVLGYLRRRPWRLPLLLRLLPHARALSCSTATAARSRAASSTARSAAATRSSLAALDAAQFVRRLLQRGLHAEALAAIETPSPARAIGWC